MKKYKYFKIVRAKRKNMGSTAWPYIIRDRENQTTVGHIGKLNCENHYTSFFIDDCFYLSAKMHREIATFMEELK